MITPLCLLLTVAIHAEVNHKPLDPGDASPPLTISAWVKGQPVTRFEKGHVYVVEFWATWCGPCRVSMPHLSKLAREFGDKVTICGISVFERGEDADEIKDDVTKFIDDMGDKVTYRIGLDDGDKMAKAWMEAAGESGIPTAFIVDRQGKIAWIGHPMNDLDKVLADVIADKHDVKAFAVARKKEREEEARRERLFAPILALARAKQPKEAVAALDKMISEHPEYKELTATFRFGQLIEYDKVAAVEAARDLVVGPLKDNSRGLAMVIRELTGPGATADCRKTAESVIARFRELTGNAAYLYERLAAAYYAAGDQKAAAAWQEKAIADLEKAESDEDELGAARTKLAEYRGEKPGLKKE